MNQASNAELVSFFKALADASRLKIIGLLAQHPCSVEELAAMLDLRPSTVSHHLARLADAGLVSGHSEGYYSVYQLEERALQEKTRHLFSHERLAGVAAEADAGAFDQKVLADFTGRDGRLKTIPAQRKKLEVVLRHVVRAFEPGVRYSEKRVNEILSRFHVDTATLRRELVGAGLMRRAGGGGDYWRVADNQEGEGKVAPT
ncbi:MAG: metalloregulator ArsR/SmtB family transcription factor [Anaerolineales bacterium]|jgi:biotin operon repressor